MSNPNPKKPRRGLSITINPAYNPNTKRAAKISTGCPPKKRHKVEERQQQIAEKKALGDLYPLYH